MLHFAVEAAFDDLLARWRAHEAKQANATTALRQLAASRIELDKARTRMQALRTAIYPEATELESVVQSLWCETLETVVHLTWADQHHSRPGNFHCICGALMPIDWHEVSRRGQ